MEMPSEVVDHLSEAESWELLNATEVGRLAVNIAGHPDIFPINYIVDGNQLVFRTAPGTKLAGAVLGHYVAFEIDGYMPERREAWSVIVKGSATEIDGMQERFDAEDLPLFSWIASPKPNFVRIMPSSITGRRYHLTDRSEPDLS